MKIMKKILTISLILIGFNCIAQTDSTICDSTKWAKEGTYEVIIIPESVEGTNRPSEIITGEILCTIEGSRHPINIIEIQISPYTIVRVYPKKYLNSSTK